MSNARTPFLLIAVVAAVLPLGFPATSAAADDVIEAHACLSPELTTPSIERIGGADRFEVSASTSAEEFPIGVKVAYLASGASYPDALSGAAAAGLGDGPVLLVERDVVPKAVQDELRRLRPQKIVVLGGTASISTFVELTMETYAPTVRRIEGADRFEVSANIDVEVFHASSKKIYIASGEVFPDALSASAAAGDVDAPVLLVKRDSVPTPILSVLESQQELRQIVVVGGPATVSNDVVAELAQFSSVVRRNGVDRFDVSATTSREWFCADNRATVFIASGETFPDALSGSAAAIWNGGPVLLVKHDGIPQSVADELRRLNPQRIVVLGGEKTIEKSVETQLATFLRK